jgi:hypothetical protein
MPRKSFKANYQEALEAGEIKHGEHLVLSDLPMNHAAMAMLNVFPDKSPDGNRFRSSLLHRTMVMFDPYWGSVAH